MRGLDPTTVETIDDPDDPRLEVYLGLSDQQMRQHREAHSGEFGGIFMAEGDVVIQRAIDAGHELLSVFVEAHRTRPFDFDLDVGVVPVLRAGEPVVEVIASHRRYRGAMASFRRPVPVDPAEVLAGSRTVVVTEHVNNPTNMGVIIRTASGLGVDGLLVDPSSCDPLARRTCRVSMGTTFSLAHTRLAPLPAGLAPLRDFTTLALTPADDAMPLGQLRLRADEPVAVLLGAEEPGLTEATQQAADHRVSIPMHGGVDSLNVATAAAIAMWAVQQRLEPGAMSG